MIQEINDQSVWDDFVLAQQPNSFLHSWAWGQVQADSGEGLKYLGYYNNNKLIAVCLVITVNAKRGRHYLVPHGPCLAKNTNLSADKGESTDFNIILSRFITYLKQTVRHDKVVALRIAPLLINNHNNRQLFASHNFRPSPLHVHAERTWNLDLTPSADNLLVNMRKTTRHAIKKAQQAGVTVEITGQIPGAIALDRFYSLYHQTISRHHFIPWSKETLQSQLQHFSHNHRIFMTIARYKNEDVAAAILIHYGHTVFYYHGASKKLPGSVPAAQLLQWEAINEAKRRGAYRYNFWGIEPKNAKSNHPFHGITTFKTGFGGYERDYLHAQDLPLSPLYWQLWLVDTVRKWRRGF